MRVIQGAACRTSVPTLLALAAALLVVATALPTFASAATRSVDLSGTLTVIERVDHTAATERTDHLARVRWRMPGTLVRRDGRVVSRASASVLEYRKRTDLFRGEDGQPDCRIEEFQGFRAQEGMPERETLLGVRATAINPRLRRARISIMLPTMDGPLVNVTQHFCHDTAPRADWKWLIEDPRQDVVAGANALIGIGGFRRASDADGLSMPSEVMSATNVLMRYRLGRWRARGSRIITGTLWDGTPASYTVKWNLVSRHPSRRCAAIPRSAVRGKTVRQVRRIIRAAGFRPSSTQRITSTLAARGRVVGTSATTAQSCGARVRMLVRR